MLSFLLEVVRRISNSVSTQFKKTEIKSNKGEVQDKDKKKAKSLLDRMQEGLLQTDKDKAKSGKEAGKKAKRISKNSLRNRVMQIIVGIIYVIETIITMIFTFLVSIFGITTVVMVIIVLVAYMVINAFLGGVGGFNINGLSSSSSGYSTGGNTSNVPPTSYSGNMIWGNEIDAAKLPSNQDKNIYRYISLIYEAIAENNCPVAPEFFIGMGKLESGLQFFEDPNNINNNVNDTLCDNTKGTLGPKVVDANPDFGIYQIRISHPTSDSTVGNKSIFRDKYKPKPVDAKSPLWTITRATNVGTLSWADWVKPPIQREKVFNIFVPDSVNWAVRRATYYTWGSVGFPYQKGEDWVTKYMAEFGLTTELQKKQIMAAVYGTAHGHGNCGVTGGVAHGEACVAFVCAAIAAADGDLHNIKIAAGEGYPHNIVQQAIMGTQSFSGSYKVSVNGQVLNESLYSYTKKKYVATHPEVFTMIESRVKWVHGYGIAAQLYGRVVLEDTLSKLGITQWGYDENGNLKIGDASVTGAMVGDTYVLSNGIKIPTFSGFKNINVSGVSNPLAYVIFNKTSGCEKIKLGTLGTNKDGSTYQNTVSSAGCTAVSLTMLYALVNQDITTFNPYNLGADFYSNPAYFGPGGGILWGSAPNYLNKLAKKATLVETTQKYVRSVDGAPLSDADYDLITKAIVDPNKVVMFGFIGSMQNHSQFDKFSDEVKALRSKSSGKKEFWTWGSTHWVACPGTFDNGNLVILDPSDVGKSQYHKFNFDEHIAPFLQRVTIYDVVPK